jgi:hypothetical protein
MERTLRALAKEARQSLESAAARTQVQWSFRVVRGAPAAELLAAAEASDFVIACLEAPPEGTAPASVRIVRAGDVEALRAALQEADGGVIVLVGADEGAIGETLRKALGQDRHGEQSARRR